ncbi:alpha-xenorhabdolysin family binary toxin subunit A [Pseudomonas sp. NPDC090202]|uniref:alpha-xenorhabdolysin family binary toxin subunit A n=1 Tax=unclassified Pseudomonas TaxID=196821 RepID=UPI00382EFE86
MSQTDAVDKDSPTPEQINTATLNFMNAVSKGDPQFERDPGLVLTNEDIRKIRRYVENGLKLPLELVDVKASMGNYKGDIKGLEPESIQDLYIAINKHAKSWLPVQSEIKQVGQDLNAFSLGIAVTAEVLVQGLESLESYRQLKLEDLTPEQIEKVASEKIMPGDRKTIDSLIALFDEMRRHIATHGVSTTNAKEGISKFKKDLEENLNREVTLKANLANTADTRETVAGLKTDIAELQKRIDQKSDEYSTFCRNAWIGVWWGPLGAAISGSIYGPKATRVLREKNALLEQKRPLDDKLAALNKFLADLSKTKSTLDEIVTLVDGAIAGISTLESLWDSLITLVESSRKELNDIDNAMLLIILVSRFKTVVSYWSEIKTKSHKLVTAFDVALKNS